MATSRLCSIPGCGKRHKAHGFCGPHYRRLRNHGDPHAGRIPNGEALAFLNDVVLTYEGDECLIWPYAKDRNGYAQVWLDGRSQSVPRLVCDYANGAPPSPKQDAAHSCGKGDKACVTKGHLSWKTRAANCADKIIHGTSRRGEQHKLAKLTEADARAIIASKEVQTVLAKRYGVTQQTISDIRCGRRWTYLMPLDTESQPV